jgi:sucrose-6-phosphate hydrolase SacC (GH32 family)
MREPCSDDVDGDDDSLSYTNVVVLLLFCPLSSSSSPQGIPRTLTLDSKTGINLIQWPIEEVNALRMGQVSKTDVKLDAGAVVRVEGAVGGQVRERALTRSSRLQSFFLCMQLAVNAQVLHLQNCHCHCFLRRSQLPNLLQNWHCP